MSETTTKGGYGQAIPPPRAAAPLATVASAAPLAIRQDGWTADQTAVLRAMGLEHATDSDLKLFHHYAARTGLDPFTRQVYMVSRRTKVKVRELNAETGNERTVERDVDKFTIQVGIDGWRVLGTRASHRDGVRVGHEDVLYRAKTANGVSEWRDYWDNADGAPLAVKYVLTVDGVKISATCMYAEYVQMTRDGGDWKPNSMWTKMPANQIAKCGEALAWRKAFPADFAGLVLEDAAQADVIDGEVVEGDAARPNNAEPRRARGANRVRQRAEAAAREGRRQWLDRMVELFAAANLTRDDDQLVVIAELGGLADLPNDRDSIADDVLRKVVTNLDDMSRASGEPGGKTLEAQIDDSVRAWDQRQAREAAQADTQDAPQDQPRMVTLGQLTKLGVLLTNRGFDKTAEGRAGRLDFCSSAIRQYMPESPYAGRTINSSKELTFAEAHMLIELLEDDERQKETATEIAERLDSDGPSEYDSPGSTECTDVSPEDSSPGQGRMDFSDDGT